MHSHSFPELSALARSSSRKLWKGTKRLGIEDEEDEEEEGEEEEEELINESYKRVLERDVFVPLLFNGEKEE